MEKKHPFQKAMRHVIAILIGAVLGFGIGFGISAALNEMKMCISLPIYVGMVLWLYVTVLLAIWLHEAGHLVCGLLSGYRFASYRAGRLMLYRKEGRMRIGFYHVPGTGGQCLMVPQTEQGEPYPFVLYNAGGVLANALGAIALAGAGLAVSQPFLRLMLLVAAAIQVIMGVPNLLSLKTIPTDGQNIRNMRKNEAQRIAFWRMLHIYEACLNAVPLREQPTDWFDDTPPGEGDDPLTLSIKASSALRLTDEGRFDEAAALYRALLADGRMAQTQRNECACELLLLLCATEGASEETAALETKELRRYIAATKGSLSRAALVLVQTLSSGDAAAVEKAERFWQARLQHYPIEGERSCYEILVQCAKTRHAAAK